VIEVYAITDHPAPPLPGVGALRVVATGELEAVCAPASDGDASPETLWHREEIVEALMEDRDLLPVRYGTRFDDEETAARAVQRRHAELTAALNRVRGAVELSVRVVNAEEPAHEWTGSDPTAYLRARASSMALQASALRTLHEPLSALARATMQRPPRAPSELLRGAYLVDRDDVMRFAALVGRLQDESPTLRLLCTGPWPPYSFAEAPLPKPAPGAPPPGGTTPWA
jgi:hypothetical protein